VNAPTAAAPFTLLASTAVKPVLEAMLPEYERSGAARLDVSIASSAAILARVKAGETPDMVILTREGIDELTALGKIVPDSRKPVAAAGLGIAVRHGAPRPDISTTDALVRTLLAARSVAYTANGASGRYFAQLLHRLGIAQAMQKTAVVLQRGSTGQAVARGEAELAVQMVSELLAAPAVDYVGPLPPEVQNNMMFTAGSLTGSARGAEARALLDYLATPAVGAVFRAKGLEPATR
jgi:molybdate transport system substrate-binding protein